LDGPRLICCKIAASCEFFVERVERIHLRFIHGFYIESKKDGKLLFTTTDTFSADGKVLTLTTKGVNAKGQSVNSVRVYEKPSEVIPQFTSTWQRLLLSIICLLGAVICALGVYLWHWWPEEWQAGLVFILAGLLVLAPVTVREIQLRKRAFVRS
jgi:hypothetical protein